MNRTMGVMVGLGILSMIGPVVTDYINKNIIQDYQPVSKNDHKLAIAKGGTGFLQELLREGRWV